MKLQARGPDDAKIVFVCDSGRWEDKDSAQIFSGRRMELFDALLRSAGISPSSVRFTAIREEIGSGRMVESSDIRDSDRFAAYDILQRHPKANLFIPLGEFAMGLLTGHHGIDKWHLSIVPSLAGNRKCMPLHSPERIWREFKLSAYVSHGMLRASLQGEFPEIKRKAYNFWLGPKQEEIRAFLDSIVPGQVLSIDIETHEHQITCVGIAKSATDAICIPATQSNWGKNQLFEIWTWVAQLLEDPQYPKVFHNFIYDCMYFSRYGISVANIHHDTMIGMKFLHPELEMGLDNAARIYTTEPYWKDDGKTWGKKAESNIHKHWEYNCRDTTNTFEIYEAEMVDLAERGLMPLWDNYIKRLMPCAFEMCSRGIQVSTLNKLALSSELGAKIEILNNQLNREFNERVQMNVNPRSPAQVKKALKALKYKLPTKKGKEASDKKALVKLRHRYPKEKVFDYLLQISGLQKLKSSYADFSLAADARMRYTLNIHGTETGRFSGHNDPWGNGINPQTVPQRIKHLFVASPNRIMMEVDLSQAESRFVAWDAPEPKLIQMFQENRDIHKFVAGRLFNAKEESVTKSQRQLGKKSGHAANYGVGPKTFAESALVEQNLYLTNEKAAALIKGYYEIFPKILDWHRKIQNEVRNTRELTTPLGRVRTFYDRLGDDMFREAYAYRPQSTIPDITNHLMLALDPYVELLLQVHDSLLFEVLPEDVDMVLEMIWAGQWHPEINLAGGKLIIPVEIKAGLSWGTMKQVKEGEVWSMSV